MHPVHVLALLAMFGESLAGLLLVASNASNASLWPSNEPIARHSIGNHRAANITSSPSALVHESIQTLQKSAGPKLAATFTVAGKTSKVSFVSPIPTAYIDITIASEIPEDYLSAPATAVIASQTTLYGASEAKNATGSIQKPRIAFKISALASTVLNIIEIIFRALNTVLTLYVLRISLRILGKLSCPRPHCRLCPLIVPWMRFTSTIVITHG